MAVLVGVGVTGTAVGGSSTRRVGVGLSTDGRLCSGATPNLSRVKAARRTITVMRIARARVARLAANSFSRVKMVSPRFFCAARSSYRP
jgi:hypothetical protein